MDDIVNSDGDMTPKPKLLFTGGGGSGAGAFKNLLSSKYESFFADADKEAKPYNIDRKNWHSLPNANSSNFINEVIKLCAQLSIDLLIPSVDEELIPLAKVRSKLPCNLLLPPEAFIATHLDKLESNRTLVSNGLPAPKTLLCGEQPLDFPCVVKPRTGRGSRHFLIAESMEDVHAHILLSRLGASNFIYQEFLLGDEFTVLIFSDLKGRLQSIVPVKVGLKKGITIRATTVFDDAVISACQKIHETNPISGCYNIQLMKTAEGMVLPFEINPRISTTSCLAFAAGVDFFAPFVGLKETSEGKTFVKDFHVGLKIKRSWHNEIF